MLITDLNIILRHILWIKASPTSEGLVNYITVKLNFLYNYLSLSILSVRFLCYQ